MPSIIARFVQQPTETLDYDVDFTDWFVDRADSPASFVAVAEDDADITVTSSRSGNVVRVVVSGGTSGTSYKITVRLTTTDLIVKEVDFVVRMKAV